MNHLEKEINYIISQIKYLQKDYGFKISKKIEYNEWGHIYLKNLKTNNTDKAISYYLYKLNDFYKKIIKYGYLQFYIRKQGKYLNGKYFELEMFVYDMEHKLNRKISNKIVYIIKNIIKEGFEKK